MTAVPGTAGRLAELYGLRPQPLYGPSGSAVYDVISRRDPEEISEVLRLAKGPVLELACGSGRLTLPLAARGHQVVALDNSPALLALLTDRLQHGDVRVVEQDMTGFSFEQSFGLIVLAASSVCLLDAEQRVSTFRRVRDHLAEDGLFYVSVLDLADGLVSRLRPTERVNILIDGDSVLTLHQYFDGRRRVRITSLMHEVVRDHSTVDRALYTSEINILGSAELASELAAVGLRVVDTRRGASGEQVPVRMVCRRCP